ncbi:MAG: hypothetical protein JNK90_15720 [Planctomycetaceae bacterium]|nr:hypothetical protein [Planctomycetaceae bacterium]
MSLPRHTQDEVQALLRQTLPNGCSLHDAILALQKEHAIPTLDLVKPVAAVCEMQIADARLAVVRATNDNAERSIYREI